MQNIYTALLAAQADLPSIDKDSKNPFHKNQYASLPNILSKVLPILRKHGILFSAPTDMTMITIRLIHAESGECIESRLPLPHTDKAQEIGSAITYYERYGLLGLLGISADMDDDGNEASGLSTKAKIAPKAETVRTLSLANETITTAIIQLTIVKKAALESLGKDYIDNMRKAMKDKTLTQDQAIDFYTKLQAL